MWSILTLWLIRFLRKRVSTYRNFLVESHLIKPWCFLICTAGNNLIQGILKNKAKNRHEAIVESCKSFYFSFLYFVEPNIWLISFLLKVFLLNAFQASSALCLCLMYCLEAFHIKREKEHFLNYFISVRLHS